MAQDYLKMAQALSQLADPGIRGLGQDSTRLQLQATSSSPISSIHHPSWGSVDPPPEGTIPPDPPVNTPSSRTNVNNLNTKSPGGLPSLWHTWVTNSTLKKMRYTWGEALAGPTVARNATANWTTTGRLDWAHNGKNEMAHS